MRTPITATVVAVAGLAAVSTLGVASAEAPTGAAPTRSVSVEGLGTAPIPQEAEQVTANNAYRQAMAAALSDGQGKASFLAEKAGGSLGPALSIVEDGGGVGCKGEAPEMPYYSYQGAQPDIGYARNVSTPPLAAAAAPKAPAGAGKPTVKKHKKRRAKKSSTVTCTVSAEVSLAYTLQ